MKTDIIKEEDFGRFDVDGELYYFRKSDLSLSRIPSAALRYVRSSELHKGMVLVEVVTDEMTVLSAVEAARYSLKKDRLEEKIAKDGFDADKWYDVQKDITLPLITQLEGKGYITGGIFDYKVDSDWFAFGIYKNDERLGILWIYNEVREANPYEKWIFTPPDNKQIDSRLKKCLEDFVSKSKYPGVLIEPEKEEIKDTQKPAEETAQIDSAATEQPE
ncbi:hypothetical protein J4482_04990 [Candidatus Woesearchaeota archaeon]|nr:hypothetical protein [Candidatus Woesearchaeota archaeon]